LKSGVRFDAALCQGCGGCATTCPSGAVRHAYPRVSDLGGRLKTLLSAYRQAGGEEACILFHDAKGGRERLMQLARHGKGLPARMILRYGVRGIPEESSSMSMTWQTPVFF